MKKISVNKGVKVFLGVNKYDFLLSNVLFLQNMV